MSWGRWLDVGPASIMDGSDLEKQTLDVRHQEFERRWKKKKYIDKNLGILSL